MLAHSLWGATSGLNYVILNVTQLTNRTCLLYKCIWTNLHDTSACSTIHLNKSYTLPLSQDCWPEQALLGQCTNFWKCHLSLQVTTPHTHTVNENAIHYSLLSLVVNVADTNTFQIASPVFNSVNYHLVFLFNVNALIACAM